MLKSHSASKAENVVTGVVLWRPLHALATLNRRARPRGPFEYRSAMAVFMESSSFLCAIVSTCSGNKNRARPFTDLSAKASRPVNPGRERPRDRNWSLLFMPVDCVAPEGSRGRENTAAAVPGPEPEFADVSKSEARSGGGPFPLDVRLQQHSTTVSSC